MMQSRAYFIDVSRVEDNLAHLLEHCIIHQIADLMVADGNQFLLGDCHGVVGPGALVFVVECLSQPAIECVQSFLADKPEIPQSVVACEIEQIKAEDDRELIIKGSIENVTRAINRIFRDGRIMELEKMSKPVVNEADDKPTDQTIVYGAELKPITFILDVYLDNPSVDDRLIFSKLHMAISSLVAQATNNDSAYAIEYYQDYYEQDRIVSFSYMHKTVDREAPDRITERLRGIIASSELWADQQKFSDYRALASESASEKCSILDYLSVTASERYLTKLFTPARVCRLWRQLRVRLL